MRIDERVRKRMEELIERGTYIEAQHPQYADPMGRLLIHESEGWVASALNVLQLVFPDPTSSHRTRASVMAPASNKVGKINAILRAALLDIEAGVIATVADAARGEVFDDFLDHADQFLRANRIDRAGVVAGVVFEDTTRRACTKHGIPEKNEDLEQLIIALTKRGLLTDLKAKRASSRGIANEGDARSVGRGGAQRRRGDDQVHARDDRHAPRGLAREVSEAEWHHAQCSTSAGAAFIGGLVRLKRSVA